MSKLEALRKLKEEYEVRIKKDGKAAVTEAFKELFDKFPELGSVVWLQFTPYFNDGEPCYFRVNELDFNLAKDAPEEWKSTFGEWDGANLSSYYYGESLYPSNYEEIPRLKELAKTVKSLNKDMPKDLLLYVFGDHCKVIVTKDKVEAEEYEHD